MVKQKATNTIRRRNRALLPHWCPAVHQHGQVCCMGKNVYVPYHSSGILKAVHKSYNRVVGSTHAVLEIMECVHNVSGE